KKEGMWSCIFCLVRNQASAFRCIVCQAPHQTSTLKIMFPSKNGEWDCDTCLVRNNVSANEYVACQTPNPKVRALSAPA
ncbi:unnamed protein product, partial [Tetraodon nigroviridis]